MEAKSHTLRRFFEVGHTYWYYFKIFFVSLKNMPMIILHSLFQALSFRYILYSKLFVLINKHLLLSTYCM